MSDEKAYSIKLPLYFEFIVVSTGATMRMYHRGGDVWECYTFDSDCQPGLGGKWREIEILQRITTGGWIYYWDTSMPNKPKTIPLSEAVAMVKADIEEACIEITKKVVVKIKGVKYEAEGDDADKLVHLHEEYQQLKDVLDALKKYEVK